MTLRELTGQYSAVFEMAEEGNIDPQIMKDTLECVDYEFEQKAELMRQSWTRWQERLIRSIKRLHV